MRKYRFSTTLVIVSCVALALTAMSGCKGKKKGDLDQGAVAGGETTSTDGQPNVDLDSILFGPSGLQPVYFDFDSSALNASAVATLATNADLIKNNAGVLIQIAGNCDERGTQEYNMALGERRALAVRDHLISLGVGGDRLVTISYGEENPVATGSDESAWKLNRRAEFNKAQAK